MRPSLRRRSALRRSEARDPFVEGLPRVDEPRYVAVPVRRSIAGTSSRYSYFSVRQRKRSGSRSQSALRRRRYVSYGRKAAASVTCSCTPPQVLPACLWNVGRKTCGRKTTPGRPSAFARVGRLVRVEPRRADELERPRRAAPLRQVRALDEAAARIDERGVGRRHVRRRQHPPASRRLAARRRAAALRASARP